MPKRVLRLAKRIGEERVEERRAAAEKYLKVPLPARRQRSQGQPVPMVACVQTTAGDSKSASGRLREPAGSATSAEEK